jgi:hypothetical protein
MKHPMSSVAAITGLGITEMGRVSLPRLYSWRWKMQGCRNPI